MFHDEFKINKLLNKHLAENNNVEGESIVEDKKNNAKTKVGEKKTK